MTKFTLLFGAIGVIALAFGAVASDGLGFAAGRSGSRLSST
jgi:hypothetical protein